MRLKTFKKTITCLYILKINFQIINSTITIYLIIFGFNFQFFDNSCFLYFICYIFFLFQGVFVLQDNSFKLLTHISATKQYLEKAPKVS